jgi:hypothetical protein
VVVVTTFDPISSEQTEGLKEIALAITPLLFQLSQIDNKSEDLEFGGWRFLFMTLERLLGSEKFQVFLGRYMKEKEGGQK